MMDVILARWLASMVAACWQFSLLFVVVALLTSLLRRWLTPAARHLLWSLLRLRLALPFGLEAPFGVAPRPEVWVDRLDAAARSFFAGFTDRDSTPLASSQRGREAQGRFVIAEPPPAVAGADSATHGLGTKSGPIGASPASVLFFALWIGGVVGIAALHLRRAGRARRGVRTPTDSLSDDARTALIRAADALGLRHLPRVALIDEPAAAIRIAGVAAPRLDLPARMNNNWSAGELEPVILHELAHLKRRDPWTRAACNLVQTIFFFHPLVWIAARQVRVERELACDDLAVRQCASGRRGYVEALLRLAREPQGAGLDRPAALAATGHRSGLRFRVSRLLADDYRPALRTSPVVAIGVALAIAVGAGGSIYGERPAPPVDGEARQSPHATHSHSKQTPPTPEQARDALAALVGGDGGEVVDVHHGPKVQFPPASRSFYSRPPYLAVRSKPDAPADLAAVPEGVYSFELKFDGAGRVSAVELSFFLSPTNAFIASSPDDPIPGAIAAFDARVLVDWIEGFVLAIPAGLAVEPSALGASVDVEVRGGRATVLTRAPASVDDLRATIAQHYRLAPGRSLDLLLPPYAETRAAFYRFGSPGQARVVPQGATRMTITLDGDGHPNYGGSAFGCGDLRALLEAIGRGNGDPTVEGDAELLDQEVGADVLAREGTPLATLLAELEVALRERIGLEVDLVHTREPSRTIVLRGSLGELAPDPHSEGGLALIEFYGDVRTDGTGGSGGTGPAAPILTHVLARATGMPVVDETTDALDIVSVRQHAAPLDERNLEPMLRQLEEQTGLEISIETRPAERVVVSAL